MKGTKNMITLKASKYCVDCENYESKVYVRTSPTDFKEVTNDLTDEDKDELIDDLIYAIHDILTSKKEEK